MFLAFKPYFNIGSLEIHYYAIFIMTGVLIALWLGLREAKKLGISSDSIYLGLLICLPLAIVGARIWYVLFNITNFHNFGEVLGFYNGRFQGLSGLAFKICLLYCTSTVLIKMTILFLIIG